jgi:hypothetical protein
MDIDLAFVSFSVRRARLVYIFYLVKSLNPVLCFVRNVETYHLLSEGRQ